MTTTTEAFPATRITILLTLSLLLSTTFRLTSTTAAISRIDRKTLRRVTTFHAFALEGVQLAIGVTGICDFCSTISGHGGLARVLASTALHVVPILAVDVIETLVVLGRARRPMQAQTFVLCRKRLWPALINLLRGKREAFRLEVPKAGGVVMVAKKGLGLRGARKVVLLDGARGRRYSDGELGVGWETRRAEQGSTMAIARRRSFPDHRLNTRPLLLDTRLLSARSRANTMDTGASTHQSRSRTLSTSTKPCSSDRANSSSRVRKIVGRIEGRGSPSRGRKKPREMAGNGAGDRRGSRHAAPRWRPAGGSAR